MINATETSPATKRPRRMARDRYPASGASSSVHAPATAERPKAVKTNSKAGLVLTMLQRAEGATIDQLAAATAWLPHTTRAALTGLKKKGHQITSSKTEGEERVYRVVIG